MQASLGSNFTAKDLIHRATLNCKEGWEVSSRGRTTQKSSGDFGAHLAFSATADLRNGHTHTLYFLFNLFCVILKI